MHVNRNSFPSRLQVSVPHPHPPLRRKVDDEIDRRFFLVTHGLKRPRSPRTTAPTCERTDPPERGPHPRRLGDLRHRPSSTRRERAVEGRDVGPIPFSPAASTLKELWGRTLYSTFRKVARGALRLIAESGGRASTQRERQPASLKRLAKEKLLAADRRGKTRKGKTGLAGRKSFRQNGDTV